jgi:uncharacterized protein YeaO (DUF488 family)
MAKGRLDIRLKRAYEPPSAEDGQRVLVDRLWPRGLGKSEAAIDRWLTEVAPSSELRRWFGHDPQKWYEFRSKYEAELWDRGDLLRELRQAAQEGPLTLVYSARDQEHNQALVLRDVLERAPPDG